MGIQKAVLKVFGCGRKCIKRLATVKPQKSTTHDIGGLQMAPTLKCDILEIRKNESSEIRKKADEILKRLRMYFNAKYYEESLPEVCKNVAFGKISNESELTYSKYKALEALSRKKTETFVFWGAESGTPFDLHKMMTEYGKTPIEIAKDMPIEKIKQAYSKFDGFFKKMEYKDPTFEHFMNMLILKKYNPKTYEHIMNTKDKNQIYTILNWGCNFGEIPSSTMLKNITPEQIRVMTHDTLPPNLKNICSYVEDSNAFVRNKEAVKQLNEDLAKIHLSSDVTLYRGEQTVGMFDSVAIDKKLERQIRKLLLRNKKVAKNMKVTTYSGQYGVGPSKNLYDFLSSKESLTLADAMQVAKFGDENFVNEVIGRIQKAKVVDTRFKSFSFDEDMASGWRKLQSRDNTTIVQKAIIKSGTQGGYHSGNNAQFEVILNNTAKEITCPEVMYNKAEDTFEIGTIIQNI